MTSATRSMSVASSPRPMMFMLPQPNDGFAWVQASAGPALVCRALEPVAHLFTTRGWSLGSQTAGDADDGWGQVAAALDVDAASLVRAHQVHGAVVLVRRAGQTDAPGCFAQPSRRGHHHLERLGRGARDSNGRLRPAPAGRSPHGCCGRGARRLARSGCSSARGGGRCAGARIRQPPRGSRRGRGAIDQRFALRSGHRGAREL